jgi:hypothetical protein
MKKVSDFTILQALSLSLQAPTNGEIFTTTAIHVALTLTLPVAFFREMTISTHTSTRSGAPHFVCARHVAVAVS